MPVPADLTPAQILETYLPAEWARARAGATPAPGATIEIVLAGDGGGTWTVAISDGALTTTAGAALGAIDLRVALSVDDFRAAVQGEPGAPDVFPHDLDLGRALARIPGGAGVPALAPGAVQVAITGFHGRTWSIRIESGGSATPSAQITVDAATLLAMRDGALDPASAFFGGKIQLGGDVAWIMQAGMAFMQGGGSGRGPMN